MWGKHTMIVSVSTLCERSLDAKFWSEEGDNKSLSQQPILEIILQVSLFTRAGKSLN